MTKKISGAAGSNDHPARRSTYDVASVPPHYDVPTPDFDAIENAVRLDSNESAFGTSQAAIAAYRDCADLHRYPDIGAKTLRESLAKHHNLDPDRIIVGAGSGEVIYSLGQAYLSPGDEIIFSEHTFGIYDTIARLNGATPVPVPERAWTADPDGMMVALGEKTRLVCLANPDNPTGTYLADRNVRRILDNLPGNALFLHDETYAQFATQPDFPDGFKLVNDFKSVIVTRTFSKIFGLAALRLGWAYTSPAVADVLRRYKGPFNVSAPSEAAAVAALGDTKFIERSVRHNMTWRQKIATYLPEIGLKVPDSASNFIMILFPEDAGKTAGDAQKYLLQQNIFLRPLARWGIPDGIRMTIGSDEENQRVVDALTAFMTRNSLEP